MGRPKKIRKIDGVTASVVESEGAQAVEAATGFAEQLQEEKAEAAEGKELAKELRSVKEKDQFNILLKTVFKLKGDPAFKSDFTDTRWPRLDNGQLIVCTRVYYPAIEGPWKEAYGVRSLGERETEQLAIVIDNIPNDKFWTEERILAKKWVCESSHYRYFWMREGEKFDKVDLEDPENVFASRFKRLEKEPSFSFGPVNPARDLESKIYGTWQ